MLWFHTEVRMPSNRRAFRIQIFSIACLFLACQAFPQDTGQKKDPKKVWTNDDLAHLAARPTTNAPTLHASEEAPPETSVEKHYVRARDAKWYVSQLKPLQIQVEQIDSQLRSLRQARKDGRGTTGAVALDQDSEGVTTDAQIQILEQRRKQLLLQIDDLEDQSRQNGLDPGAVRSEVAEAIPGPAGVAETALGPNKASFVEEDTRIAETENALERKKEHLQRAKKEAELLQRNLDLQRRQVTSNPEYLTRHIGDSKIASAANEIKEKEQEIQATEQRIADLQEHLEDQKLNRSANEAAETNAVAHDLTGAPKEKEEKTEAYWRKRFSELHYKIRIAQSELDLLQREWNVLLLQYDPNPAKAMRESITRKQINEHRKKIGDKNAEFRQLRQQLSDLEDELRHSGGDAGWSRE
jgi:hypothetical protein